MTLKLTLTGASVNEDASNIKLAGSDESGNITEIEFSPENGEELLSALVTVLGQSARRRTGDNTLVKVLPVDWWEINPSPDKTSVLFSFRMTGGMEVTFGLPTDASQRLSEGLQAVLGNTPNQPYDGTIQ